VGISPPLQTVPKLFVGLPASRQFCRISGAQNHGQVGPHALNLRNWGQGKVRTKFVRSSARLRCWNGASESAEFGNDDQMASIRFLRPGVPTLPNYGVRSRQKRRAENYKMAQGSQDLFTLMIFVFLQLRWRDRHGPQTCESAESSQTFQSWGSGRRFGRVVPTSDSLTQGAFAKIRGRRRGGSPRQGTVGLPARTKAWVGTPITLCLIGLQTWPIFTAGEEAGRRHSQKNKQFQGQLLPPRLSDQITLEWLKRRISTEWKEEPDKFFLSIFGAAEKAPGAVRAVQGHFAAGFVCQN